MSMVTKAAKITVDLGNPRLYKAVKILAIERGLTLREVVVEALKEWVEKQEDLEDLADAQERLGEPTRPIEEIIKELGTKSHIHRGIAKETPLAERVKELCGSFDNYLDVYTNSSFTRGQLDAHLRTLALREQLGGVQKCLNSEEFVRALWKTLAAWGVNRGSDGLSSEAELRQSLKANQNAILALESVKIDELNEQQTTLMANNLWDIITLLKVSASASQIVAGTKALHHILPELVPPIDRKWTGSFFGKRPPAFQGTDSRAEALFKDIFRTYTAVALQVYPRQYIGGGWRSSVTKVIDNAVIGFGHAYPAIVYRHNARRLR